MRPQLILLLSLVGNLVLGATAYHFFRPSASKLQADSTKNLQEKTGDVEKVSERTDAAALVVTNVVADDFSWHNVETPDYKTYIANLRAVGCPEETIRDIILADVNKLYRTKQKTITGDFGERTYWKTEDQWNTKAGREKQKLTQALYKEKSALLVELLGVDPEKERNKEMGYEDYWDRQVNFLPAEKQAKAREIQQKFQEQKQEFYRDAIYDADDWKKLRQIEKSEEAELSTMLTPDEVEQFQLRNSQTANQLRSDLEGFEPSEAEFKEIFHLREARADDLINSNDQDDKETHDRYRKTKEEVDAQIKAQLGDTRYAEYERSQDWNFKELARMTERLDLPKQAAVAVYDMKKVAEDQVKQIRADKTLSEDQRSQALQAVRAETEKAVTTSLGSEKNFNRYKSRNGWWISNLAPTPRPKPKTIATP